ncbi:hypothetical protein FCI23_52650 [Actinacidiphila oryziradicis]|uniref:Carboxylate-amine ligase n=1 Tax=Actinacidiphila oryziradicis TaxID=2571141 RepID=A0A4U0RJD5_9ACTN|nr:hypothetical protein FCI23_52650 [Actinacidiphila oryziradicis]
MITLGVEEEYLLLDPASGLPVPLADEVRAAADLESAVNPGEVQPELLQVQVEVATPVCRNLKEVGGHLSRMRHALSAAAEKAGCRIAACGAAPFTVEGQLAVRPGGRLLLPRSAPPPTRRPGARGRRRPTACVLARCGAPGRGSDRRPTPACTGTSTRGFAHHGAEPGLAQRALAYERRAGAITARLTRLLGGKRAGRRPRTSVSASRARASPAGDPGRGVRLGRGPRLRHAPHARDGRPLRPRHQRLAPERPVGRPLSLDHRQRLGPGRVRGVLRGGPTRAPPRTEGDESPDAPVRLRRLPVHPAGRPGADPRPGIGVGGDQGDPPHRPAGPHRRLRAVHRLRHRCLLPQRRTAAGGGGLRLVAEEQHQGQSTRLVPNAACVAPPAAALRSWSVARAAPVCRLGCSARGASRSRWSSVTTTPGERSRSGPRRTPLTLCCRVGTLAGLRSVRQRLRCMRTDRGRYPV